MCRKLIVSLDQNKADLQVFHLRRETFYAYGVENKVSICKTQSLDECSGVNVQLPQIGQILRYRGESRSSHGRIENLVDWGPRRPGLETPVLMYPKYSLVGWI